MKTETKQVNSAEWADTFAGWYNLPYCLATWPLGNNSRVCCQSNTNTPSPERRCSFSTHSSHVRLSAGVNTEQKLLRPPPQRSLPQTLRSITLNWFPSATNGEGLSLFIYDRLNLEGSEKRREIERQVHKKRRDPILHEYIIATHSDRAGAD